MLRKLLKLTDSFFCVSASQSSFTEELNAALRLAFKVVLCILVVSTLLTSQNIAQIPNPTNLLLFSISVAFFFSLLTRSTLIICPSLSFALYILYSFIFVRGWNWNMIGIALSLAVFTYWIIYLLGEKENLEELIPESLIEALHAGIQIMLFLWSLSALEITQLKAHNILTIKDLDSKMIIVLVGFFLYALYLWRLWRGGWWISFLITLLMYSFLDNLSWHSSGSTLNFSSLFQQWTDKNALGNVIDLFHLPSVLELSLLIFLLFQEGILFLKKKKHLQPIPVNSEKINLKLQNLPILAISLTPFLGLGIYHVLKDPLSKPQKEAYSGFCGFISALFMGIAWFYLDYLLCIPFSILIIPISMVSLKNASKLILPLLHQKTLSKLIPNLMAIILVPITFNLGFSLTVSLLMHLIFSYFEKKEKKRLWSLAFLASICVISLLF